MAVEAIRAAIGEDGIQIAAGALKDIAADEGADDGVRIQAAHLLLQYGLAHVDAFGNAVTG